MAEKKEKENGMEREIELNVKLHDLFKEYIENYGHDCKSADSLDYVVIDDGQSFLYGQRTYLYEILISKKFGFIKWLVENDKIDVEKIEKRNLIPIDASLRHKVEDEERNNVNRLWETKILMLLSISDSPIDDLISYLK